MAVLALFALACTPGPIRPQPGDDDAGEPVVNFSDAGEDPPDADAGEETIDGGGATSDAGDVGPDAGRAPPDGTEGGDCYGNGTCNDTLVCLRGTCRPQPPPDDGTLGGDCYGNGTCNAGLRCEAGTCLPESGPDVGEEGGRCRADGGCDAGLTCVEGTCEVDVRPPAGSLGGPCYGNGTCNQALHCESGECVADPPPATGTLGGACYGNGTCNTGLTCDGGTCRSSTGPAPGAEGGQCLTNGTCNSGLSCDNGTCRAATPPAQGSLGGACYGNGTCDANLVCSSGTCQFDASGAEGTLGGACFADGTCNPGLTCMLGLICFAADPAAVCGNGTVESGEACDGNAVANGTCVSCRISCQSNFANCDEQASNGCEVDLRSDASNCGRCDNSCSTNQCVSSQCTRPPAPVGLTLLYETYSTTDFLVSGSTVWFVAPDGDMYTGTTTGGATTLFDAYNDKLTAMTLDATTVYWNYNGDIYRMARGGGTLDQVASAGITGATHLHVAGNLLHVAGPTGLALVTISNKTTSRLHTMTVNEARTNGSQTYYRDLAGGRILEKANAMGAGTTEFATTQNSPAGIELDGTHLYWVNEFGANVVRLSLNNAGGTPEVLASSEGAPTRLTVTGTHVVWWNSSTKVLRKRALSGGSASNVATGVEGVTRMKAFDGTVYVAHRIGAETWLSKFVP